MNSINQGWGMKVTRERGGEGEREKDGRQGWWGT